MFVLKENISFLFDLCLLDLNNHKEQNLKVNFKKRREFRTRMYQSTSYNRRKFLLDQECKPVLLILPIPRGGQASL